MKCARFAPAAALAAMAIGWFAAVRIAVAEENSTKQPTAVAEPAERDWREALAAVLAEQTSLKFANTPLQEAIDAIKERHKVNLVFDRQNLEDAGKFVKDLTVTIDVREITLKSALKLMLDQHDMTIVPQDEVLLITTGEAADSKPEARIYDVSDLVRGAEDGEYDYEPLIDAIGATIAPSSWPEVGGPLPIGSLHGCLIIDQTSAVHELIAEFLAALRKVRKQQENGEFGKATVVGSGQEVPAKLEKLLALKTSLRYKETPLATVIDDLQKRTGINFVYNATELSDSGMDPATMLVTIDVQDVSVRAALNLVCRQLGVAWYAKDESVQISTPADFDQVGELRIYPVADLVGPNLRTDAEKKLGHQPTDPDPLVDAISGNIAKETWGGSGGPGSITDFDDEYPVLVVLQTAEVHQSIAEFLASLRKARASQRERLGKLAAEAAKPQKPVLGVYHLRASEPKEPAMTPKEVADTVKALVAPESWKGEDVYIQGVTGRLIVRQTPEVHAEIVKLLWELKVSAGGGIKLPRPAGGGGF